MFCSDCSPTNRPRYLHDMASMLAVQEVLHDELDLYLHTYRLEINELELAMISTGLVQNLEKLLLGGLQCSEFYTQQSH